MIVETKPLTDLQKENLLANLGMSLRSHNAWAVVRAYELGKAQAEQPKAQKVCALLKPKE